MGRRLRNSLENAKDRRARFRRGFSFGFFAISYAYAALGWLVSVISQQIAVTDAGPLSVIVITLGLAVATYAAAIVFTELGATFRVESLWLGFMSALYSLMAFALIFAGTILFLVPMITR